MAYLFLTRDLFTNNESTFTTCLLLSTYESQHPLLQIYLVVLATYQYICFLQKLKKNSPSTCTVLTPNHGNPHSYPQASLDNPAQTNITGRKPVRPHRHHRWETGPATQTSPVGNRSGHTDITCGKPVRSHRHHRWETGPATQTSPVGNRSALHTVRGSHLRSSDLDNGDNILDITLGSKHTYCATD